MQWKRIFLQKSFYFAIALQFLSFFYSHSNTGFLSFFVPYFQMGNVFYHFEIGAVDGLAVLFLPFVALLPAALFVAEDFDTDFISLVLQRTDLKKYAFTRNLQAFTGGMVASALGTLLYLGMLLLLSPLGGDNTGYWELRSIGIFRFFVLPCHGLPYMLETTFRFALTAGVWALVGTGIAAFTKKASLALTLTFILHHTLIIFMEAFDTLIFWSPALLQSPQDYPGAPSLLTVYLRQGVSLIGAGGFSAFAFWKTFHQKP